MFWIPNPIYKLLPYLYIVIGIVVFYAMDHPTSDAASFVLLLAGFVVWKQRYDYKTNN